ncbi:MAG: DsbA family protein, partial [Methylovirgula sp.]
MQKKLPLMRRRTLLELAAAAVLTLAGVAGVVDPWSKPVHAQGTVVPLAQLMEQQALPDIAQGKADAPITMIEYASMTCTHCAAFHATTYPTLISKYVDTGKVRFILREFPLDPLATAAFMLARCSGPEKRNAVVDLLFDQQKNWAFTDKPLEALANLLKQTGMTQATFETCINDQSLYEKVDQERDNAAQKFGIDATPTFFINGRKISGEVTPDALDKLLEPM